jgi:hypothetical protein
MYCERCGKQIEEALNFCNGCGAQIKRNGETEHKSVLNTLIVALIVVVTSGLGVLAGLLAILLDRLPFAEPILIFAGVYLFVLFGICFLIMRQVSKMIDAKLGINKFAEPAGRSTEPLIKLPPRTTAQLEEFREPASVIDNTTRTLDEVPLGKRA